MNNASDQSTGTPAPVTAGAIPWYKSPIYIAAMTTVLGAIATLYPKAAAVIGINTPLGQTAFIELAGGLVTLAGGGVIWVMRQINKGQPITLTQAAANVHPSTIAVVETQAAMAQAGIPTAVTLQAQITKDAKP
jgi:hypothetical protein